MKLHARELYFNIVFTFSSISIAIIICIYPSESLIIQRLLILDIPDEPTKYSVFILLLINNFSPKLTSFRAPTVIKYAIKVNI